MSETVEILRKAREIISDEKNWTQGAYARLYNDDEDSVCADLDEASCFCAVGAIHKAGGLSISCRLPIELVVPFLSDDALREYRDFCLEGKIVEFNDNHSQKEVLALFDRAIARAESEAA